METTKYLDMAVNVILEYGPGLLMALAMLVGGLWVIKRVVATVTNVMVARGVDESLRPFFISMMDVGMKVVLLLAVAGKIGIETTSFIAIFSALALAIGFALQGSLGNFASGILILLFRPYKVGDLITVDDKTGVVQEIQIFNTILRTANNKTIIIPNSKVTEGALEKVASDEPVLVETVFHVEDNTSINLLRAVAQKVNADCPFTMKEKDPVVRVAAYPMAAVQVEICFWAMGSQYRDVFFHVNESLKAGFDASGVQLSKEDWERA